MTPETQFLNDSLYSQICTTITTKSKNSMKKGRGEINPSLEMTIKMAHRLIKWCSSSLYYHGKPKPDNNETSHHIENSTHKDKYLC